MIRKSLTTAAACALLVLASASADAQGFYPRDWAYGRSGLFARDYITPYYDEPGYLYGNSSSARSTNAGKFVFAAASVDERCQQDGSPQVTILEAPRGSRIATDLGRFVAVQNDGGSKRCLGATVRGTRIFYRGRSGHSDRLVLRVVYPTTGLTYDHVIAVR
jgi:hypothetical protein